MEEIDVYPALYDLFCEFISADEITKYDENGKPYKVKIVKGLPGLVLKFKKKYKLFKK